MCKQEFLYQAVHQAEVEETPKIIAAVEAAIDEVVDLKKNMQIQLALEEAIVNISSYAYQDMESVEKIIKINIWRSQTKLTIEIKDYGIAYNPLENKEPNLSLPIEECKVGGLGIHFIRNLIDEVVYERKSIANVLTLMIKLGSNK